MSKPTHLFKSERKFFRDNFRAYFRHVYFDEKIHPKKMETMLPMNRDSFIHIKKVLSHRFDLTHIGLGRTTLRCLKCGFLVQDVFIEKTFFDALMEHAELTRFSEDYRSCDESLVEKVLNE